MGLKLDNYEVCHPDYGRVVVASIGRDSATLAAFRSWGAEEEWGREAGYCDVRKLGPAQKPRCRRCGGEYGTPGDPRGGLCPSCARSAEIDAKAKAVRSRKQRAGYREREVYHADF